MTVEICSTYLGPCIVGRNRTYIVDAFCICIGFLPFYSLGNRSFADIHFTMNLLCFVVDPPYENQASLSQSGLGAEFLWV